MPTEIDTNLPIHNPDTLCDAAWRLCFAKILVSQNFRGPSWRKQVPKTNRECNELPTIFAPPLVAMKTLHGKDPLKKVSTRSLSSAKLPPWACSHSMKLPLMTRPVFCARCNS